MNRNRKVIVNGLLIVLAVLLLAGMVVQFTPAISSMNLFSSGPKGTPALKVNGQTVTVEQLEALRRSNPVLSSTDTGVLGDDFKTYTVARMIQQKLVTEASSDVKVSRGDVNAEVDKVREANNLKDNKAWTDALQGAGLTDAGYREQLRDSLAIQRKADEIKKTAAPATDAEAQLYYQLNPQAFQSDARIVGRQIVVADQAKAKALLAQVKAGGDFAALASANNTAGDYKDRGGALGPLENGSPRPVAQVALPTEVGAAAFALKSGGVTDVIASGGKFYIVKVERLVAPSTKPFADARADAVSAVNEQKKNAALEAWVDGLRKSAKVEYVDLNWKTTDPTVASVAGRNIPYSEVLEQVVGNQQFSQLLQQVPPEQAAGLVNGILKPQVVGQLLQGYAAPTIVSDLKLALTGPRQQLAAGLAAYGARDVTASDADIQAFYTQNAKNYQTPASATVSEASFASKAKADAFRAAWNGQGDFVQAASKAGGTVSEHGAVTAGDQKLSAALEPAVFGTASQPAGLRDVADGSLSAVTPNNGRYAVLYVTELKPAATQTLSAVRDSIQTQVLASKKAEAGQKFLAEKVAALKPKDDLKTVLDLQAKRLAAAAPKTPSTPASGTTTPGTGSAGTGSTGTGSAGTGSSTTPATPATPATK